MEGEKKNVMKKNIEHNVYMTFIAFYDFLKTMFKILFAAFFTFDTLRCCGRV